MGILSVTEEAHRLLNLCFVVACRDDSCRRNGLLRSRADHKKRWSTLRGAWLLRSQLWLVTATLLGDSPSFVMATAAGLVPGGGSIAIEQHLVQPVVVAYDPSGSLYYGTYHQVWRLNPDGTATLIAGN